MNYKIKIKLPKNITRQFGSSIQTEKNLSTLNNNQLLDILNNYANHIALAININNIILNNEKIIWDPTETQKEFLNNYYTQPFLIFADSQTTPGTNNTIEETQGQQIYSYILKNQRISLDTIREKYNTLGLNLSNTFRHIGINYYIPDEINPAYIGINKILKPTTEIFEIIVREFVKNKWVKLPLTIENWRDFRTYNTYNLNGQIYNVPRLEKNPIPEFIAVLEKIKAETIPTLELQNLTIQAMTEIRSKLQNPTKTEYEEYRKTLPFCYRQITNIPQIASYLRALDGINYYVPAYTHLPDDLRNILKKEVVTQDSKANSVFKDIQENQQGLLNLEADFQTEFYCTDDPRFIPFLETLQTREEQNIFNYLFNALKYRGIKEIEGMRSFNLSTHHFNTRESETPEFQIYFKNSTIETENGFFVRSNMIKAGETEANNFKLNMANFSPANYKFDAVLQKNNLVYAIIEFDGSYHFKPFNKNDNFIQRLTADQIKSAFYEYLKNEKQEIIIIRIPEYTSKAKGQKWKDEFKSYVVKTLAGYLGYQNDNNTNIENYQPEK